MLARGIRALLAVILAASMLTCARSSPHFLLVILVDTLRADHLGCYGYEAVETPVIDHLAETGILYENAITAVPVTLPSTATILTGALPVQHGIRDNGPFQLGDRWVTAAELFRDAGYATAAFVSADVLSREHNLSQGFDVYDDDVSETYTAYNAEIAEIQDQFQGIERRAGSTVDRVLEWVREQPRKNTFLLVHFFDPHVPRDPPPPFNDSYSDRPYDGEIAYVDAEIGRLLDGIRSRRSHSRIQIVFVSDHGEGLGDHDEMLHGDLLFDETVHVPLILQGDGIAAGVRQPALVRTADIVPTLCSLAHIQPPAWSVGIPLPGIDNGTGAPPAPSGLPGQFRDAAYIETFRPRLSYNWCELRSIRTDRWKCIEGPAYELYDLEADPGETKNIAEDHATLCDSLAHLMDSMAFWCVHHGAHAADAITLSEKSRKKLESIGYITPETTRPATSDSLAVWYFPPAERGRALHLPHPRLQVAKSLHRKAAENMCVIAYRALKAGDLLEAKQRFEAAIRHKEGMAKAHLGLAEVERRSGRLDESERQLRRVWEMRPADPLVAAALMDGFTRIGLYDEALRVADDAITRGFADSAFIDAAASLRRQVKARH